MWFGYKGDDNRVLVHDPLVSDEDVGFRVVLISFVGQNLTRETGRNGKGVFEVYSEAGSERRTTREKTGVTTKGDTRTHHKSLRRETTESNIM